MVRQLPSTLFGSGSNSLRRLSFLSASSILRSRSSVAPRLLSTSSRLSASITATLPRLQPRKNDLGLPKTPLTEAQLAEIEKSETAAKTNLDGASRSGIVKLDGSNEKSSPPPSSSAPPPAGSSAGSSGDGNNSAAPPSSGDGSDAPPPATGVSKRSVPEVYPQVLALPITRRPLFPGFYKAVVIRNPAVVAAIKEMMKRGQPYIGAFLLKDENADSDM